jgi:hypothetical protein
MKEYRDCFVSDGERNSTQGFNRSDIELKLVPATIHGVDIVKREAPAIFCTGTQL